MAEVEATVEEAPQGEVLPLQEGPTVVAAGEVLGGDADGTREVRWSLYVPQRFAARLAGDEHYYLDYLRGRHGVSVHVAKNRLHVKGREAEVAVCLAYLKALVADWHRWETPSQ